MTNKSQEFEKILKRISFYLKIMGMHLDSADCSRTLIQRVAHRWIFIAHYIAIGYGSITQPIEFIKLAISGNNFVELTYVGPCQSITVLCMFKAYYFLKCYHLIHDVIESLKGSFNDKEISKNDFVTKQIKYVNVVLSMLLFIDFNGVMAFSFGPPILTGIEYYYSGEIKFYLPYYLWYPFDITIFRYWIFAYMHQIWSGFIVVLFVFGADCIFFICSAFISIQFDSVQNELVDRISQVTEGTMQYSEFKQCLGKFILQHKEILRWLNLLEQIYSKSNLINLLTNSLIICLSLFNITTIENIVLWIPFIFFLFFGLWQIFFFCYFGDLIMRTSTGVSDAIYASKWYKCSPAVKKDILFIILRCQKPCILTAFGYTDINLRAFTKILKSSWSYFALLKTVYHK